MATFGLDSAYVAKLKKEVEVANILVDQASDFFLLPQINVIFEYAGDKLKELVCAKLKNGSYGPKPPIEMEIPKTSRVNGKNTSIVGPNYFRPGSVLWPEDRVVYHFLAQEACDIIEKTIDRARVFSNKPLEKKGAGFTSASLQWSALKKSFEDEIKSDGYTLAFKCDIAQYFFSINQHELVNHLEHQGYPTELTKFMEKFLASLTLDRSSRGIIQGVYGSAVLGNGYLVSIDELIRDHDVMHYRYVDDMYLLFKNNDDFRKFFPILVKNLRDYDLSLNENKTFIIPPAKLLREETELDKAIERAKEEARDKLTDYEEVEIDSGPYESGTVTALIESEPNEEEVELHATLEVFLSLDDFQGDERDRAEAFCLAFFRRASDPTAIDYVVKRWLRNPDKAREYALYLARFARDPAHAPKIDALVVASAPHMIDFQWCWAALVARLLPTVSDELLNVAAKIQDDGARHDVIRSILTYVLCKHGSPARKKKIRDNYNSSPLLVQLAILHASDGFTAGERSALLKTAEAHGDLQALLCEAMRAAKNQSQKGTQIKS